MRRSEALQHLRAREVWSHEYCCVSIKQDGDGNDGEAYFSRSGCDICSDLFAVRDDHRFDDEGDDTPLRPRSDTC